MKFTPIGIIHTPFVRQPGTPIQSVFAKDARGTIKLRAKYKNGLRDLAGFERLWLFYWFDRAGPVHMRVVPFRDTVKRGLFATRAPCRPNPIGLSCVRLLSVAGNVLSIADVDMLDGTPLLDIKPYVPQFDAFPKSCSGWISGRVRKRTLADSRFGL